MNFSFYSHSFGCRVNQAEKETLDRQLLDLGCCIDPISPDFYIINTCAVTQKAERETRQLLYQIRRKLPLTKIIITGCSATLWLKNRSYPSDIDLIIDNKDKDNMLDIIVNRLKLKKTLPKGLRAKNSRFLKSGRLLVKIQDGCQRFCSYCLTARLRGIPRSKTIKDILKEIKNQQEGTREVILTGINTEYFGRDHGESLPGLIETIVAKTEIPRISFGSIHPWSIDKTFLNLYKNILNLKRLVDFFHIPLQSGSNRILSLMKRGYTKEEFSEKLQVIAATNPYAFISTDLIAGFVGESDKEFEETLDFLEKSPISGFHIFRFSQRPMTAAFFMAKKIAEPSQSKKQSRAETLRGLSRKKYLMFLEMNLGRTSSALFLAEKKGDYCQALLDNQLPILVNSDKALAGEIKNVKILEVKKGRLIGKLV
ncbi:MiaB/RimO family radical SAM methylthiotransferase [Candidatus Roizmanbacteria bacterium]|nr:MiaB/RimO family radical SAM methylthiotransferase [Candidatus Roizmanbacteria bacterium]